MDIAEKLREMTNTLKGLSGYETQSQRKDKHVARMRKQVARLQVNSLSKRKTDSVRHHSNDRNTTNM